jgi:hypothetical protein
MSQPITWLKLLAGAVIMVALFVLANIYAYDTAGYFARERDYRQQVDGIATHPDVRIVFAGDSHFGVPLNDYLNGNPAGPAYSIAYGGDSLRECYAKVRRVLESSPTIDTLIVTADPHMFAQGRLESSNRSFADLYFLEARDRTGLPHDWASAVLDQIPLLNDDFLQYLRKAIAASLSGASAHARGADDPAAWSRLSDEERNAEAHDTGVGDHAGIATSTRPFMWYQRILDLARSHHVRVVGLRFPVHHEYSAQAPPSQVAAIDAFLRSHGVTQIIDMRGALTDPRDFEDEDHVNQVGVVPLVTMLEQRLGRPLLARDVVAGSPPRAH